ncbi:autotransporter-associated beta strand repeat-containing protein [Polaribacter filamentus]|nr:autotransporter-associated beta strand repeat-containing protein [Polaribacter filamentus]
MVTKKTYDIPFPSKIKDFMSLASITMFIFLGFTFSVNAQHSNIEITTAATTGGTWNAAAPWVFTPNTDNVNIQNTDIQNKLNTGDVTIVTNNTYGTQSGVVNILTSITSTSSNTAGRSFTIEANDAITVSGNLDLYSANYINHGKNIILRSTQGSIQVNNRLFTYQTGTGAMGTVPRSAGNITLDAVNGSVRVNNILDTRGGNNTSYGTNHYNIGTYSSLSGDVTITGPLGVSLTQDMNLYNPSYNQYGFMNGTLTIDTDATVLTTATGINDGHTTGTLAIGALVKNGTGIFALNAVTWYGSSYPSYSPTTVNQGTLKLLRTNTLQISGPLTVNTSAVVDMYNYNHQLGTIDGGGTITSSGSGTYTLNVGTGNGASSFSGILENGSATALNLTKSGSGTLTLSGPNTYTGTTTIATGTINAQHDTALGAVSGPTIVNNGTTLQIEGGVSIAEPITLYGAGISNTGALRSLSGNNTYSGTITSNANTVYIKADADILSITGGLVLNISTYMAGNGTIHIPSVISGAQPFYKTENGTLILSGANTYTNATTIQDGVLTIQHNQALGTTGQGTTISNGATLQLENNITTADALTLNGLGHSSLGVLRNLSGNNTVTGNINCANNTVKIHNEAGLLTLSGNIAINNITYFQGPSNIVSTGVISGAQPLIKEGTGILTIGGVAANTYTNYTQITQGILRFGANDALGGPNSIVKFNGGILETNGFSSSTGQLELPLSSTLSLGSGDHTISFASAANFEFEQLTITGWQGTYGANTSGTNGKVKVGTSQVLTKQQIDAMRFLNSADNQLYFAVQRTDGEVIPGNIVSGNETGHSNIEITTAATTGGTWNAAAPWVFTPNTDNVNIQNTDIQNKLNTGDVTIVTNNTYGTQSGVVNILTSITSTSSNTAGRSFTIEANDAITVSGNLDLYSANYINHGKNIILRSTQGSIQVNNRLFTYQTGTGAMGTVPRSAGNITLDAVNGSVRVNNILDTRGGNNTSYGTNHYNIGTYSSLSGDVTITGPLGVSLTQDMNLYNPSYNQYGFMNGTLTIDTDATVLTTATGINDGHTTGTLAIGALVKNGTGIFALNAVTWYGSSYPSYSPTTVNQGTLKLLRTNTLQISGPLTVNTSAVVDMYNYNHQLGTIDGGGTITSSGSGTYTLNVGTGNGASSFSGILENGSATALNLTKSGSGTLTLSGPNTYTGTTTIATGTINAQHDTALGAVSGPTIVNNGTTLQIEGGVSIAEPITLYGAGISNTGALRSLSGNNTYSGTITSNANTVYIKADADILSITGGLVLNISTYMAGNGTIHIPSVISGAQPFYKTENGTLILSGANTYTNATTIQDGVLTIQHNQALGTTGQGTTISNGATLQLENNITTADALTLNGLGHSSLGVLRNLSGNNTVTGNINCANNTVKIHNEAGLLTLSGNIAINNITYFQGPSNIVSTGVISGAQPLIKEGTGILTIGGVAANTYTNYTQITQGILRFGANDALGGPNSIVKFNGGILETNGFSSSTGQLELPLSSTLSLGSGDHTISFASAANFEFEQLTITGWQGTYGANTSGTNGKVKVGTSQVLTKQQIDAMRFLNSADNQLYFAVQRTDGEVIPGNIVSGNETGHSNIEITTAATTGGTWNAAAPWVFTPNTDNVNIQNTDIQNKLNTGDVTIVTNNTYGTQSGVVNILTSITSTSSNTAGRSFTIEANDAITVSGNLDLYSANYINHGKNIILRSTQGSIQVNNRLFTYQTGTGAMGTVPRSAGNITLDAVNGSVRVNNILDTRGGNNTSYGTNHYNIGTYSSLSGDVTITGPLGVSLTQDMNLYNPSYNQYGFMNGTLTIDTDATVLTTATGINDGHTTGTLAIGALVKNGTGIFALNAVTWYGSSYPSYSPTTVNQGTLKLLRTNTLQISGPLTVNTSAVVDMYNYNHQLGTIDGGGTITSSGSGTYTLNVGTGNGASSFSGILENGSATALNLTKSGSGTLTLSGPNTYTGTTTIATGTINAQHDTALGAVSGPTIVNNGTTLQIEGGVSIAEPITLYGAGISNTGALRSLSGNNTYSGTITSNANTVYIKADADILSITGGLVLNISTYMAGNGTIHIPSVISGAQPFYKTENGTLILSGANTYTNATTIQDGVLTIQHNQALGTTGQGTTISNGATLQLENNITTADALTLNGLGHSSLGVLRNLSGNNTVTGNINCANNTVKIHNEAGLLTLSGNIAINNITYFQGPSNIVSTGVISGAQPLIKEGTGILTIGGVAANTYTNYTQITQGILRFGANDALGGPNSIVKFNGGILETNGFSSSTGQLELPLSSTLSLGSGDHTISFASAANFEFEQLTITGWQGTYGANTSGTNGKVKVGTSQVLTKQQIDAMRFLNSADNQLYFAVQRTDGEVIPGNIVSGNETGHSNIEITTAATTGGTWNAAAPWVFTPNTDNVNIQNTDIQNKLNTGDVTIVTNNTYGTQSGVVNILTSITSTSSNTAGRSFTIEANDAITVSGNLDLYSANYINHGKNIILRSTQGSIQVNNRLFTYQTGTGAMGTVPRSAGNITLDAVNGSVRVNNILDTRGGNNTSYGTNHYNIGTYSSLSGDVTITGPLGVSLTQDMNLYNPSYNQYGFMNGTLTIDTDATVLTTATGINDGHTTGTLAIGALVKNGTGIFALNAVTWYGSSYPSYSPTTVNQGTLKLLRTNTLQISGPLTVNTSAVVDMYNYNHQLGTIDGGGTITSSGSGTYTLNVGTGNGASSFSGILENGSATALNLTKSGSGTLTLSGPNTYTGTTTIATGTINAQHDTALGAVSGPTIVNNGTTLQIEGGVSIAEPITLYGAGISNTGALRSLSGNNTYSGTITSNANTVYIKADADILSITGGLVLNISTYMAGNGTIHIPSVISGAQPFYKTENGTLILSGANTYTNATTIQDGVLTIQHNQALGTTGQGTTISNGATLQLENNITTADALTLNGLGHSSLGVLRNLSGNNTVTGNINCANNTVKIHNEAGLLTLSGNIAINNITYFQGPSNIVSTGVISGAQPLIKEGTGILTIGGVAANTYTNYTQITQGILRFGANDALGGPNSIVKFNGGILETNGFSSSTGQLELPLSSTLSLGSGDHTISFASAANFEFEQLTITGWQGTYGANTSGTNGKVKVGTSQVLTKQQIDAMRFLNSADNQLYFAVQRTDGEVIPGNIVSGNETGHSNIEITTAATTGGTWNAAAPWVFTPNTDNVNIQNTDIQNKLNNGDVTIVTNNIGGKPTLTSYGEITNTGINLVNRNGKRITAGNEGIDSYGKRASSAPGTQSGVVVIKASITSTSSNTAGRSFTIEANDAITVSGNLDLYSANYINHGKNIILRSTQGSIQVNNRLFTYQTGTGAMGTIPKSAGNITLDAVNGSVRVNNILDTRGGNNTSYGTNHYNIGTYSSLSGDVTITGPLGVSLTQGMNLYNPSYNQYGFMNGTLTIDTDATVLTTATGINDGHTTGTLAIGALVKNGTGIFALNAVTWYGTSFPSYSPTTVNQGTLKLLRTNTLQTSGPLTVNTSAVVDMSNYNHQLGTIDGGGTITSSGSGTYTLNVGTGNGASSFSGILENGSATELNLTKSGNGTLTLSGPNTYTGRTTIAAGTINAQHDTALGAISGPTMVMNGTTLQIEGGVSIAEPITLYGAGISNTGALRSLSGNNTYSGTITSNTNTVYIKADADTLSITGGLVINITTYMGELET